MKTTSLLLAAAFCAASALAADLPRAFPPGELPKDARLGPLKDLDGYFPFTPPASREAWIERAEDVRMQMRVALGLWPEPTRTPLNAAVHGRIEGDDYTVEKVAFESMPGFFVTGSLFRPKGDVVAGKKRPGVLVPHGHWADARFRLIGDAELKKELETGGERLPGGGRSIFQSMGVQLARMGCVALVYDMLGDSDSQQISKALAHGFAKQRPEMNAREGWGLFSPQAEAHAQSIMGLQTWNSIRALDFLTALPDVDPQHLACTGASGGGTQTMMLAALDPRLAVACPAVMVSTAMQGGCTCENASLLRVGTGNIEIAALFAPKPQGMTTANDWTKELPEKGFPDLQKLYALMGAPENVALWAMPHFPHNYNAPTRHKIYDWFNKHFALALIAPQLEEREYTVLTREQLTVWDAAHPAPAGGPEFEKALLKWWRDDAQAQLAKSPERFREIAAPAWKAIIGRTLADAGTIVWEQRAEAVRDLGAGGKKMRVRAGVLQNAARGEATPALILEPEALGKDAECVVWLDERGKEGVSADSGATIRPEVQAILEAGHRVLSVDLLHQGAFLADGGPLAQTRRVKNPREAAAYTFGYNPAVFAQRTHDALAALRHARAITAPAAAVKLAAFGAAGPIGAAARALAGDAVQAAVIDTNGFEFGAVTDMHDVNFLPAAAKYGDLGGLLALAAPARTLVLGNDISPAVTRNAYLARGTGAQLEATKAAPAGRAPAIRWLLEGAPAGANSAPK